MAHKSSAVADDPIEVLFVLQDKFALMDFCGPREVLHWARHDKDDETSQAFECTTTGPSKKVMSEQGVLVECQLTYKEAYEGLEDYDVMVIVGGDSENILKNNLEPMPLINAFAELQKTDSSRERTLFSVCTGSLFLAEQGILSGLSATTHPDYMTKFENICSSAAQRSLQERTDVIDDSRYVVNNLRFDLDDEDENPYIRRKSDAGNPSSHGRKGSISFKGANRRESITRRAAMRLGGLRVITAGGITAGLDAAMYLVSILVDEHAADEVARQMQHEWIKGTVVDGLDV